MKSLILFLVLTCSIFQSYAQGDRILNEDLVILKNGKHITGEITNTRDNFIIIYHKSNRIVLSKSRIENIFFKGDEIHFNGSYSAKFEDGKIILLGENPEEALTINDTKYKLVPASYTHSAKRSWYNITYGSIIFPNNENLNRYNLSLENVTGYQLSQYTGIGLGVGFIASGSFGGIFGNVIPVYAEYRGYFNNSKVSVYYNLAMGFTFAVRDEFSSFTSSKPKHYFHPSIGYKIGSRRAAFMVDLGLRYTNIQYRFDDRTVFQGPLFEEYARRELVLRFGIML